MNEIPPPPSIEIIQNELTPEQQRLLDQFPTPERSQRGLSGVKGPFKPELFRLMHSSMFHSLRRLLVHMVSLHLSLLV